MAVSKRTRYEVLKRDNHTCRYCGAKAPDVPLRIDHVMPVALGGSDDASNLVTACQDCNAGKASTNPDAETVQQVSDDAVRWAVAVRKAAAEVEANRLRHVSAHAEFAEIWKSWDPDYDCLPSDAWASIDGWLDAGLPVGELLDAARVAIANRAVRHDNVFRYVAGIVRNKLVEIHERARAILDEEAPDGA